VKLNKDCADIYLQNMIKVSAAQVVGTARASGP
jgi:hypothetical protein